MAFNWFGGLGRNNPNVTELDNATNSLLNLPENRMLALNDCENIYTYWGLGKRVIHSIVRFAFSVDRDITIAEAPTEAVDEFKKAATESLKEDRIVRRASTYCRIYGMAGTYAATDSKDIKPSENLTKKQCQENKLTLNALNPLNLSGTVFNQEALSPKFQKPETIRVAGQTVGTKRATVIQNNEPVYLRFTDPTFTFSGVSVFQNMVRLIKAWTRSIISLERMATKASSIIFKEGARGKMGGIQAEAAKRSLQRIKEMENTGAASIDKDGDVTFFPLTGVAYVDAILVGLEREIMMALDDTPAAILLGKELSTGLNEGKEELKAIIMAVDNFREDVLTPLYEWADPYVMAIAWTDEFIEKVKKENMDKYGSFTVSEIRQIWEQSFTFEYGNLYPEPEKAIQETSGVILDNLNKARNMGLDIADIESEINERKLFKNDVTMSADNITGDEDDEDPFAKEIKDSDPSGNDEE